MKDIHFLKIFSNNLQKPHFFFHKTKIVVFPIVKFLQKRQTSKYAIGITCNKLQ